MSNTPTGNPHAQSVLSALNAAEVMVARGEVYPRDAAKLAINAQAMLALAYEQRTANMIAAFGNLIDGESDTFLGERIDGYKLATTIRDRIITANAGPGEIVIPAPTLPTKAVGSKDSHYLRTAARNIQSGYNVGGSGVTHMIITLLTNTAEAMEAEGN
jgi:hypothetical protein